MQAAIVESSPTVQLRTMLTISASGSGLPSMRSFASRVVTSAPASPSARRSASWARMWPSNSNAMSAMAARSWASVAAWFLRTHSRSGPCSAAGQPMKAHSMRIAQSRAKSSIHSTSPRSGRRTDHLARDPPALGLERGERLRAEVRLDQAPVGGVLRRVHAVGHVQVSGDLAAERRRVVQHAHHVRVAEEGRVQVVAVRHRAAAPHRVVGLDLVRLHVGGTRVPGGPVARGDVSHPCRPAGCS